jgi:hypothetical protein
MGASITSNKILARNIDTSLSSWILELRLVSFRSNTGI